jgi:hypothetical protein
MVLNPTLVLCFHPKKEKKKMFGYFNDYLMTKLILVYNNSWFVGSIMNKKIN